MASKTKKTAARKTAKKTLTAKDQENLVTTLVPLFQAVVQTWVALAELPAVGNKLAADTKEADALRKHELDLLKADPEYARMKMEKQMDLDRSRSEKRYEALNVSLVGIGTTLAKIPWEKLPLGEAGKNETEGLRRDVQSLRDGYKHIHDQTKLHDTRFTTLFDDVQDLREDEVRSSAAITRLAERLDEVKEHVQGVEKSVSSHG